MSWLRYCNPLRQWFQYAFMFSGSKPFNTLFRATDINYHLPPILGENLSVICILKNLCWSPTNTRSITVFSLTAFNAWFLSNFKPELSEIMICPARPKCKQEVQEVDNGERKRFMSVIGAWSRCLEEWRVLTRITHELRSSWTIITKTKTFI